mgnify:CR=1 FL=1
MSVLQFDHDEVRDVYVPVNPAARALCDAFEEQFLWDSQLTSLSKGFVIEVGVVTRVYKSYTPIPNTDENPF